MHINCCNANGPRAFALIPKAMYHAEENSIMINLYADSKTTINLGAKRNQPVTISQKTTYPAGNVVEIEVAPRKTATFQIALRIPAWAALDKCVIEVNGTPEKIATHGWHVITREWQAGDKITLSLDMRGRLVERNNHQAIVRGPVVLARDSRMGDGFVDETSVVQSKDGYVELTTIASPDFAWLSFTAPMVMGTDLEGNNAPSQIKLCDFGSAGNTWDKQVRYRVWLPKTLHVMTTPYIPYNRDPNAQ